MIRAAHQIETGSAMAVGLIGAAAAGLSNTVLNWMHAFCTTEACKNQKKQAAQQLEAAELYLEAQKVGLLAASAQQQAAAQRTQVLMVLGAGALGLGALYLVGR